LKNNLKHTRAFFITLNQHGTVRRHYLVGHGGQVPHSIPITL
jgi:hypothetical protein